MSDKKLRVYTNEVEWVIAFDEADAAEVWAETIGEPCAADVEWTECPASGLFTITIDGRSDTRTFGDWAAARGRSYLAAENY